MKKIARRQFLLGAAGALIASSCNSSSKSVSQLLPTPAEVEGPFYPITAQKDKDFDLTQISGQSGTAKGKIVTIQGRVVDTSGQAIEGASIELWQANAVGRYRHPHDPNKAALDPNFQGWAIVLSGKQGGFKFKTIVPGAYQASADWIRPPHIHFKISKQTYHAIITQMYFPGEALNTSDLLLSKKNLAEQKHMIAKQDKKDKTKYLYSIILSKV